MDDALDREFAIVELEGRATAAPDELHWLGSGGWGSGSAGGSGGSGGSGGGSGT